MEKIAKEKRSECKLELLVDLVKDDIITITEAAKRANMAETVFVENMKQFKGEYRECNIKCVSYR